MEIELTVRAAVLTDIGELAWTGGEAHLRAVTDGMIAALTGTRAQLAVELANGRLIAFGVVDFAKVPDAGTIMMLSVHDTWQSLGIGSLLIRALEELVVESGRTRALIGVEHDNPRAAALYRRLGYTEIGDEVDHWVEGHDRTYVTVCTILERSLVVHFAP